MSAAWALALNVQLGVKPKEGGEEVGGACGNEDGGPCGGVAADLREATDNFKDGVPKRWIPRWLGGGGEVGFGILAMRVPYEPGRTRPARPLTNPAEPALRVPLRTRQNPPCASPTNPSEPALRVPYKPGRTRHARPLTNPAEPALRVPLRTRQNPPCASPSETSENSEPVLTSPSKTSEPVLTSPSETSETSELNPSSRPPLKPLKPLNPSSRPPLKLLKPLKPSSRPHYEPGRTRLFVYPSETSKLALRIPPPTSLKTGGMSARPGSGMEGTSAVTEGTRGAGSAGFRGDTQAGSAGAVGRCAGAGALRTVVSVR
ncbi:hypothetical protein T492DRAFT_832695 [Pavlovales sp. CCMP2436]|nr:hypothetical protein T492DRAFT_832695 [Pavlovales sp. CCMP2436]